MRAVELRKGSSVVLVSVLPPAGAGGAWRLAVNANGQAVSGSSTLPGGIRVGVTTFTPAAKGVKARATIDAGGNDTIWGSLASMSVVSVLKAHGARARPSPISQFSPWMNLRFG